MTRECHVRFCERLGVQFPGATRHDIPPVTPIVVEHRLHQRICPCCQSATRAVLPADVESGGYGPRLTALVGRLGGTFHLSHLKIQRFLHEGFGVRISTGGYGLRPTASTAASGGGSTAFWSSQWRRLTSGCKGSPSCRR
jgi:hypothetical protein